MAERPTEGFWFFGQLLLTVDNDIPLNAPFFTQTVGAHVKMTTKRQTYKERAERLARTIDIAEKVIIDSKSLDEKIRTHFLKWGRLLNLLE